MADKHKFYIVEASALPEVFLKVAEVKRLLSTGEAATVNDAARMVGISRSAFYKYRDAIMPFQNMTGRVITFQFLLQDQQGVLSLILKIFAENGANIQTINSVSPSNGCAFLTITAETAGLTLSLEELLHRLEGIPGVIRAEILAG
ncbi:MAG: ACT domain-containing protein [Oscillospiraceae bacterium]|nr:ACT domain-containing protein [Oscillospiraceae bacterium]